MGFLIEFGRSRLNFKEIVFWEDSDTITMFDQIGDDCKTIKKEQEKS